MRSEILAYIIPQFQGLYYVSYLGHLLGHSKSSVINLSTSLYNMFRKSTVSMKKPFCAVGS